MELFYDRKQTLLCSIKSIAARALWGYIPTEDYQKDIRVRQCFLKARNPVGD